MLLSRGRMFGQQIRYAITPQRTASGTGKHRFFRATLRITLPGALYVSAICVLPTILIDRFRVPFYFGGTALLIVVGVALDTIAALETHMISRSYEGFMKRGRIRGRR